MRGEHEHSLTRLLQAVDGSPPSTLFHYTTASGLSSILSTGRIWATDLEYLNDSRELRYGLELLRDAMLAHEDGRWSRDVDVILGFRELPPAQRIMVTCYCEDGDLLGQWRGYGASAGYSIGFDTGALGPLLKGRGYGLPFSPVSYDEELSKGLTEVWARLVLEAWSELRQSEKWPADGDPSDPEATEALAKALYEFTGAKLMPAVVPCAYIKDPSFAEEREWRTVRPVWPRTGDHGKDISFRAGSTGLTPFVELDFREDNGRIPLSEVVVGPGGEAHLRANAVRMLLKELRYSEDVTVRVSEVPFRAGV